MPKTDQEPLAKQVSLNMLIELRGVEKVDEKWPRLVSLSHTQHLSTN